MNTKFSIQHIAAFLLIAPLSATWVAPVQAAAPVTSLHNPAPITLAGKDDKGPRKPAPKPGPRDGGDGE